MMFVIALLIAIFVFYTLNRFSDEPVKLFKLNFWKTQGHKKTVGELLSNVNEKKIPLLCRLNFHFYEYAFISFSDQPFYGEDNCILEGKHVERCKRCSIEKKPVSRKTKRGEVEW